MYANHRQWWPDQTYFTSVPNRTDLGHGVAGASVSTSFAAADVSQSTQILNLQRQQYSVAEPFGSHSALNMMTSTPEDAWYAEQQHPLTWSNAVDIIINIPSRVTCPAGPVGSIFQPEPGQWRIPDSTVSAPGTDMRPLLAASMQANASTHEPAVPHNLSPGQMNGRQDAAARSISDVSRSFANLGLKVEVNKPGSQRQATIASLPPAPSKSASKAPGIATLSQLEQQVKSGQLTEFDLFMQQDERLIGCEDAKNTQQQRAYGFTLDTFAAPPAASAAGRSTDGTTSGAGPSHAQGRVTRITDVCVGDKVQVEPLTGDDVLSQLPITGIVSEIVIPDPIQPQGVLVLLEDSTMGHTLQVLHTAYKQTQEAFPTLGNTTAAPLSANTAGSKQSKNQQHTAHALTSPTALQHQNYVSGGNVGSQYRPQKPATSNASSRPGQWYDTDPVSYLGTQLVPLQRDGPDEDELVSTRHARKDSGSSNACRPSGSVRVVQGGLDRGKKNRSRPDSLASNGNISAMDSDAEVDMMAMSAADGAGGGPGHRLSNMGRSGGSAMNRPPPLFKHVGPSILQGLTDEQILEKWQEVQKRFGTAICEVVLCDCNNNVKEAVECMLDQDMVGDALIGIVERSVAQLEEQLEEEEQQAEDAGKWSLQSPDHSGRIKYIRPGDRRAGPPPKAASQKHYPDLHGGRGRGRGGRGSSSRAAEGSWSEGAPSIQPQKPIKLLRNTNSLASLAASAGVQARHLETMVSHYPGLTPQQCINMLHMSDNSLDIAADELLANGLAPGASPEEHSDAYDLVISLYDLNNDDHVQQQRQLDTAGYLSIAAAAQGNDLSLSRDSFDTKVQKLMEAFEGLPADIAIQTLRQAGGDLQAATTWIMQDLSARAAHEEQAAKASLTLAAKLQANASSDDDNVASGTSSPATPTGRQARSRGGRAAGGGRGGMQRGGVDKASFGSLEDAKVGDSDWAVVSTKKRVQGAVDSQPKRKLKLTADRARKIAKVYYEARNVMYTHAAAAHRAGDGKAAADLSKKGREYDELAKQYRKMANDEAYKASNWGVQNKLRVDLHGMYVEEALDKIAKQVQLAEDMNLAEGILLEVVTGKGNHSQNNIPVIKQGLLSWCRTHGIHVFEDPDNAGLVVLHVGKRND